MESSIQPSQIENSVLLQLFRDSFVMKGDFYNVKKQKVFPDIKKRMEFSSVVQGDDDIVLRDINLQEIVPVVSRQQDTSATSDELLFYYFYLPDDDLEVMENRILRMKPEDELTEIDYPLLSHFVSSVDRICGTMIHRRHFASLHRVDTRRGHRERLPLQRPVLDDDQWWSTFNSHTTEAPKKKQKRHSIDWPTQIVPKHVEYIFANDFFPYVSSSDQQHHETVPMMSRCTVDYHEYTTYPTAEELENDQSRGCISVYVSAIGKRANLNVTVLKIGDTIQSCNEIGYQKFFKIVDFHRGKICVDSDPWVLDKWGVIDNISHGNLLLKTVVLNNEELIPVAPPSRCLVKRIPALSIPLIRGIHDDTARQLERRAATVAALPDLERNTLENSYLYRAAKMCPFKLHEYQNRLPDPVYRFLDEVSYSNANDKLTPDSLCSDSEASIIQNDETECTVCGRMFSWVQTQARTKTPNPAPYYLFTNRKQFFGQFDSKQYTLKQHALEQLHLHGKEHCDGIPHAFRYPIFPFKGKSELWPWNLTLRDVIQEMLWDGWVESGGISKHICQGTLRQRDSNSLKSHMAIVLFRSKNCRVEFTKKIIKRLKGVGVIIPAGHETLEAGYRSWITIESWNQKGLEDLLDDAVRYIDKLMQMMDAFPFVTFMDSFPYESVDEKVGYAWNSLNLFFLSGVSEGVFFPKVPTLGSDHSLLFYVNQHYLKTKAFMARKATAPVQLHQESEEDSDSD